MAFQGRHDALDGLGRPSYLCVTFDRELYKSAPRYKCPPMRRKRRKRRNFGWAFALPLVLASAVGFADDKPSSSPDSKLSHRIKPRGEQPAAPIVRAEHDRPRFSKHFEMKDGDVIAFAGGSDVAKQAANGYLETILTLAATDTRVYFRNMAWQADTVYQQQRPRNFGTHLDELQRVGATVVVASFGQMETLDGVEKIPEFIAAYEALLDQYAQQTRKIALVTPIPFEARKDHPHLPDMTRHNDAVAAYGKAIRELATRRGYLAVDLTAFRSSGLTTDGVHLSDAGHWQFALELTDQLLGKSPVSSADLSIRGVFADPKLEQMRQAILAKNELWQELRRPTNWAFAYGDRTHVPSSHDHRPDMPRWFPAELDGIIPKIEQAEDQILQLR